MTSLRPRQVDFAKTWEEHCAWPLRQLFVPEAMTGDVSIPGLQLYSHVYELCVAFPDNHVVALIEHISNIFFHAAVQMRQEMLGSTGADGQTVSLDEYARGWSRYWQATRAANAACRYLNKCIRANFQTAQYPPVVTEEGPDGHAVRRLPLAPVTARVGGQLVELHIRSVEDIALHIWKQAVLHYFRERQADALVRTVLEALPSRDVDEAVLRCCLESFDCCGDDKVFDSVEEALEAFYAAEAAAFLAHNSVRTYIAFAAALISSEGARAARLWPSSPERVAAVVRCCEARLIGAHRATLQDAFDRMLRESSIAELSIVYGLLERIGGATGALQESLSALVRAEHQQVESDGKGDASDDPRLFLSRLLALQDKYTRVVREAFCNDAEMMAAVEGAIAHIVNCSKRSSPPETLAAALDLALSQDTDGEHGSEWLERTARLLPLLVHFDVFLEHYRIMLGWRLCGGRSVSLSAEEQMLAHIRQVPACPPEPASHLARMLSDATEAQHESVLVLTLHAWPSVFNPPGEDAIPVPADLVALQAHFEHQYRAAHCGRRLQWCQQLTRLTVIYTPATASDTVELSVSLLQWRVIEQLSQEAQCVAQLCGVLTCSAEELQWALRPLRAVGLVIVDAMDASSDPPLRINDSFHAPTASLSLVPSMQMLPTTDSVTAHVGTARLDRDMQHTDASGTLEQRRLFLLQSTIVSLLKARTKLSPAELVKLVTARLAAGRVHAFSPTTEQLNAAIQTLTAKGFMELNGQANLYVYIA